MSNNTKIIIGVIVLFLVTILIFIQTSVTSTPVAYESVTSLPSPMTSHVPAPRGPIDVPDQPATGDILIKSVTMPADGYVIIHALLAQNQMSGVIGNSAFLPQGVHTTLRITLYGKGGSAYSVKPGDQFVAVLYKDNGDKKYGEGDLSVRMKDLKGGDITQQFKAL
jgi:hypothetical protein